MNKFVFAFLLLFTVPSFAADKDAEYFKLVDAAIANPATAQWCEIRQLYPDTSFYRAIENPSASTLVPTMGRRMLMEKTQEAVKDFRAFQRDHFGSVNAHRYAAYLYKWHIELARESMEKVLPDFGQGIDYIDFKLERAAAKGLLDCIANSGDGKSKQTAFVTISAEEQQIMVEQYFRVDYTGAQLVRDGDAVYSIVGVQIPGGQKADVHFRLDPRLVAALKSWAEKQKP